MKNFKYVGKFKKEFKKLYKKEQKYGTLQYLNIIFKDIGMLLIITYEQHQFYSKLTR